MLHTAGVLAGALLPRRTRNRKGSFADRLGCPPAERPDPLVEHLVAAHEAGQIGRRQWWLRAPGGHGIDTTSARKTELAWLSAAQAFDRGVKQPSKRKRLAADQETVDRSGPVRVLSPEEIQRLYGQPS